jgi:hypothetical protein
MFKYKITINTYSGNVLTFSVDDFSIAEGFICFTDLKTGLRKWFPIVNCEIEEKVE